MKNRRARPILVALSGAAALAVPAGGCEERRWQPAAVGALETETVGPWDVNDTFASVDDAESLEAGRVLAESGAPQIIYSNFSDGTTTLKGGSDNASKNTSQICSTGTKGYPAWSGDLTRAKMLQASMQSMMIDFNVILTAKRPASAPYSMIMVGPQGNGCVVMGAGGVAPLDCGNGNPNNICFDFSSSGSVITMAQEIGHTFGLGHNDVSCDVMGASYSSKGCAGGWGYKDVSGPMIGGSSCGKTTQNSYQEMKKVLGAWPGGPKPDPYAGMCMDAAAPTVVLSSPPDNMRYERDFDVTGTADDDCALKEVAVDIPALGRSGTKPGSPFDWAIVEVPPGVYDVIVTATDTAGKKTEVKRKVYIMMDPPAPPDGGGGAGGAGGGAGGAGGMGGAGGGAGGGGAGGGAGGGGGGGGAGGSGGGSGGGGGKGGQGGGSGGGGGGGSGSGTTASGTGCSVGSAGAPGWLVLALVVFASRRRRS